MEQLEPCRVREVGVVGVSAQKFIGVGGILEGEVGGEVPKAAWISC